MASPGSIAQWHEEVDVLIAGFDVAGCAAALGARDADAAAKILIVEKMSEQLAGGNGRLSGQSLLISHNAEALYQYQHNMSVKNPVPDEMLREWGVARWLSLSRIFSSDVLRQVRSSFGVAAGAAAKRSTISPNSAPKMPWLTTRSSSRYRVGFGSR